MNKDFEAILKLGAILQSRNATKEEVKEAYKNSGLMQVKTDERVSEGNGKFN